ncbi:MAG: hypothetical protein FJZ57_01060 [Chlamydiae bacterium]|nr:hypothetical protein [Chlamydiota bacterium]
MKTYTSILITLLIPFTIFSSEPSKEGYVSSTNASYDGSALTLTGRVVLDHGLGKMTAEQASLEKQEAGKDFPFSLIHLHNDVILSLKDNAKLLCDHADLDFSNLTGTLTAPKSGLVNFTDTIHKKSGGDSYVNLKSPNIELCLTKEEKKDQKTEYDIEKIKAKDSCTIEYNKEFILESDHALYHKTTATSSKDFQGTVTAYPKDDQSYCKIFHDKDYIEASLVNLDLVQSVLSMNNSRGKIESSLLPQQQKGHIEFTTENLSWDNTKHSLTLNGKSHIVESALGTVTTEEVLNIQQGIIKGVKVISKIQSKGPSEFVYKDPQSASYHKLKCKGIFKIDRNLLNAQISGTSKAKTRGNYIDQVFYEEETLGAYADMAHVEFAADKQLLQPTSLTLKGNVCLFSRKEQEPFRCGIADRVTYSPETKTMILSANPGQKVLFWDEQQGVRMSASEVHLIQNPQSHQTVIQGVGNVKFTLSVEENEVLKKLFPQYKPSS